MKIMHETIIKHVVNKPVTSNNGTELGDRLLLSPLCIASWFWRCS